MFDNFWIYILPIIFNVLFIIWMKVGCEIDGFHCGVGHILLVALFSLIPIVGLCMSVVFLITYIGARCGGIIELKNNKFNRFFFDV